MNSVVTINAKVKKVGDTNYNNVLIKIPEQTKEIFKKYEFEIIEFDPVIPNTVCIFICEDQNDIFSINVNKTQQNSFQEAFEKIYQFLTTQKELNEACQTTSEQNLEDVELLKIEGKIENEIDNSQ